MIDVGTNSVKFHIGERDVDGTWRTVADRAEVSRLGEGLAEQGLINDAALERTIAAIAGMVDEARRHGVRAIAAVGTAGLRIAAQRARGRRRHPGAHRRACRGDLGRGGEPAGLPGHRRRSRHDGRLARRLRHWRRQLPVHLRPRRPRWTNASASMSGPCGTPSATSSTAPFPEVLREAMAAISADLARLDGRPVPDALVGMGGAVTNITAVMHRLATYDPTVVQGRCHRSRGDRPPDRAVPVAGCRRPPRHRRPPAEAGGSDPRRCLHRSYGHGEAG